MAAVKAYFYKLREDLPDVCEGVDIPVYMERLRATFGKAALDKVYPGTPLPGGPVYYSDAPRNCHESTKKFDLVDAISDCLRLFDKKGKARKALAKIIADKAITDKEFREKLIAYDRVPQSWSDMLEPLDPEEKPDRRELVKALTELQDRDFRHPNNAKGKRHPLARIMESKSFTDSDRLSFVADYFVGRKRKGEAPWAVRIGSRGNYQEFNRAHWLEQNNAYVLKTVGDIVRLSQHFTAVNKLRRGSTPDIPQLEPGDLKLKP